MGSMKLYEIADEYMADMRGLERLFDEDFIDAQVFNDTLENLSGDFETKALNVICFARNLEAEADAIQGAIDSMQARMKALDGKAEWIRGYIFTQMQRTGIPEIKSPYFVMKLQDNPGKVVIDCEAGIPDHCWRVVPETREPDKKEIKKMLDNGANLSFAHIEKGQRLVIK